MIAARPETRLGVRRIEDLPALAGKRALVRATLDLPMGSEAVGPMPALRLGQLTETVRALRARGAAVTVCGDTHQPGQEPDPEQDKVVYEELEAIGVRVVTGGGAGSVEDSHLLGDLVAAHDVFVNDSFQWSYLPLPSLLVPPAHLPSAAGRGLEHDLQIACSLLRSPDRPFAAVLGGADSMLRLHGLQGLILRADMVLIGGAMSLPMLEAIGKRRTDGSPDWFLSECRAVMGLAERVQHQVHLPVDVVVRRPDGSLEVCDPAGASGSEVVDIGPLTAKRFAEVVHGADTVVWTGALGRVEEPDSAEGTLAVARAVGREKSRRVVIGGDSLAAFLRSERCLERRMNLISATDALLELFKNGDLAALPALRG